MNELIDTPFYFENVDTEDVVISIKKGSTRTKTVILETSTDNTHWEFWGIDNGTPQTKTIGVGKRLYVRCVENIGYFNKTLTDCNYFSSTGAVSTGGNLMSLGYKNFENQNTIEQINAYSYVFKDMHTLVDASRLTLPATELSDNCYCFMFNGCKSLVTTPKTLPATILSEGCYEGMFDGCESLVTTPELPATALATHCYEGMFQNCVSLTTAPELPATTLVDECYARMFNNCTALTTAPALPATTLAAYCYCGMFNGCTALTSTPTLPPHKTLNMRNRRGNIFDGMFDGMFDCCTSLATPPKPPVIKFAENFYIIND